MLSRLVSTVGRFNSAAVARGAVCRPLSTCQTRLSNDVAKPAPSSGREGLAGFLEGKTGVTGAGTLGVGVVAYLISKEIYIMNNETVIAVVMGGVIYAMIRKIGKPITDAIDARSEKIKGQFYTYHNAQMKELEDSIVEQKTLNTNLAVRHDIFGVLRENNVMQLEEEYRRRWHEARSEVTRRLDYQLEVEKVKKAFHHYHMVQWVERSVIDNIKGQEDASISRCITDLKALAAA